MKHLKKLGTLLLAAAMAVTLCIGAAWGAVAADTSWYNDTDSEFTINTAAELKGLAELVNGGNNFESKTVKLGKNIDLTGVDWTPIGGLDAGKDFKGTLDGNGKTISNLTMTLGDVTDTTYAGLFSNLTGTVQNLTLRNVAISGNGSIVAGALAAQIHTHGQVSGVTINGFTFSGTGDFSIGGLVGQAHSQGALGAGGIAFLRDTTVSSVNITVTATGNSNIGGVTGYNNGYFKVNNVDANNVTLTVTANTACNVGGFFGGDAFSGAYDYKDCDVSGLNITLYGAAQVNAGGFGGYTMGGECWADPNIDTCSASGTITNYNTNESSIIGGCYGQVSGGSRDYHNCVADVDITSTVGTVGGFVGKTTNWDALTQKFNACAALGTVSGGSGTTGGFVGSPDTNSTFNGSTAAGTSFFGANAPASTFTLNLNANGGTIATPQLIATAACTVDFTTAPFQPTRKGYEFLGWAETADATADDVLVSTYSMGADTNGHTLYAVWKAIPRYYYVATDTTEEVPSSPKTFDGGVAIYAALGLSSLLGLGYVRRKH